MNIDSEKIIQKKSIYRIEIDGLRAIAVIGVFFYHLNKNLLPGGYWGVDMFFVISGYVVFLATSLRNTKDSIVSFYARRIKRIIPGALCCVFFSILFSIILLTPNSWTIRDASWALLGVQNIWLFLSSQNYFGVGLEDNIFLQFWSLGVEEQFYFIFPLIWYLISKQKVKVFIFWGILLFTASYASWSLNSIFDISSKSSLFFLPQFRAWEILSGVLLAYILHLKRENQYSIKISKFLKSKSIILIEFFFVFSILFFFFYRGDVYSTQFIETSSIVLSMIGILSLTHFNKNSFIFKFLTINPLVWIGKRSYGIYLYHWMVIVILRNTIGDENYFYYISSIIFTFLFTILSWEFVERPISNKSVLFTSIRNNFKISVSSVLLSISFMGSLLSPTIPKLLRKIPSYDFFNSFIFSFLDLKDKKMNNKVSWELNAKKCHHKHSNLSDLELTKQCLSLNRKEDPLNRVYLIGDSHAQSLMPMVINAINISSLSNSYIAKNVHIDSFNKILNDRSTYDFDYVTKNLKPKDIIVINWYSGKFNKLSTKEEEKLFSYINNFLKVIIQKEGIIILIRDNLTLKTPIRIDRCIFQDRLKLKNSCIISKDSAIKNRYEQDKFWDKVLSKNSNGNISFYDLSENMCPNKICDYKDQNGEIVMIDFNHISSFESNRQGENFSLLLKKVLSSSFKNSK